MMRPQRFSKGKIDLCMQTIQHMMGLLGSTQASSIAGIVGHSNQNSTTSSESAGPSPLLVCGCRFRISLQGTARVSPFRVISYQQFRYFDNESLGVAAPTLHTDAYRSVGTWLPHVRCYTSKRSSVMLTVSNSLFRGFVQEPVS
jgi:hypothetical protein